MKDVLNTYQEKYNSRVLFVDNSGIVILHADDFDLPTDLNRWHNFSEGVASILSNSETSLVYEPEGHMFFVSSRYIPEFDLFLVILRDNDELHQRLTNRLKLNFAIGLLITMIVVAIVAVILKRHNINLEKLAHFDPLTGALNRTAFSLLFDEAVKEKARKDVKLSLVLIDIDNFKPINDTHGHHCGDLALKAFSQKVSSLTRKVDALCRWGGEEFVLLLKGCSAVEAEKIVEKIRKDVCASDVQLGSKSIRLTFSAGVVEHKNGETLAQLAERADKLLYEAKAQGKNRVIAMS